VAATLTFLLALQVILLGGIASAYMTGCPISTRAFSRLNTSQTLAEPTTLRHETVQALPTDTGGGSANRWPRLSVPHCSQSEQTQATLCICIQQDVRTVHSNCAHHTVAPQHQHNCAHQHHCSHTAGDTHTPVQAAPWPVQQVQPVRLASCLPRA